MKEFIKKELNMLTALFLSLISVNFAGAYVGGSLSEFFGQIDPSTILLFAVFIIAFAVLFFALLRVFKNNQAVAATIAGAISLLIVYGMSTMDLSLEGLFSEIGISAEALPIVIGVVIILAAIFIIIKLKKDSLFVFGGVSLLLGIIAYEKTIPLALGCILIFVGLVLRFAKKGGSKKGKDDHSAGG